MNAQTKLCTAMAAAFKEIEGATKSANNPHFRTKYADLSAVIEAVKPSLIANDLFFTQRCVPNPDGVTVETMLHHASGEEMSLGSLYVPANKKDAQGFGSALTYARRYALMTAFGVPAEDDDGNAAAASVRPQRASTPVHTGFIDDGQWAQIVALAELKKADTARFCAYLGVSSLKEIPADRFDDAMAALNAKPTPTKEPEMVQ